MIRKKSRRLWDLTALSCHVNDRAWGAEQRDGIANFIRRNDVLAVLPTGFGKSLAYTTSTVRDICTFAVLC